MAWAKEKPLLGKEQEMEQDWSRDREGSRGLLCCSPRVDGLGKKKTWRQMVEDDVGWSSWNGPRRAALDRPQWRNDVSVLCDSWHGEIK